MNIDENKIEAAITEKTKAIVPVHYAGVSCEMDKIMELAEKYHLLVIEDAAQGIMLSLIHIYLLSKKRNAWHICWWKSQYIPAYFPEVPALRLLC